jgi:hypothetical protein
VRDVILKTLPVLNFVATVAIASTDYAPIAIMKIFSEQSFVTVAARF